MDKLKIKILNESGKINAPAYKFDAGYDLFSTEKVILAPLQRVSIPLGIAIEIPNNLVGIVQTKTSTSIKLGYDIIGPVIDSNYRGQIHCIILNTTNNILEIEIGQKIAQLVLLRYETPEIEYVKELSESDRGDKWNGSSSK